MYSSPREWSWEPRVTIHPSLPEMTPLRIPSPAPDSLEYSCQGSEESSFSGDESCPPCELGEGDVLSVSGRGVIPYALGEGATSRGLVGVPPPNPSAARLEGRSARKLRIKLKSRSLGESSQSRPETTTVCVVDASYTLGPLPGGGEVVPVEPSKVPQKKVLQKALSEAESRLIKVFDQRLKEGRLWDVNMKPSLSSLKWAGIVSGSPELSCPDLELSSSCFLSIGGGESVRFHGSEDDDVRSYVGSEEAGLQTPPLQDLIGIPSLDETGRRGAGGRGCPDSPNRTRMSTCDLDDHDPRSSRDAEDRPPRPPSAELTMGKGVASDYPRESQKRRLPTGPIDFQDPFGGRDGNFLPRELRFAGPELKICGLPYPDDGFICCESNALALAQAMANVSLADQKVYRHETKGRMAEWMGQDLNFNLVLDEEIASLHELHKELTTKYNESQDSVRRLEGSLKKEKNQSTSHLTALESAQSKCGELERKIESLEKRITELEQQRPSSIDEMIDLWQASEEGMAAITELAPPSTKAGYNIAFQHFASYLSKVPSGKKWDGLPWPHEDIGVTDQNIRYYITDGPPPSIVKDADEEGEPGEVNIAYS
ncbi:hypothetical protein Dimus_029170 [Dionaea muscipula]